MANLTITPLDVAAVEVFEQLTGPTDEDIDAGEVVRYATATGFFTLANGSSAGEGRVVGIALNSGLAGQTITVIKRGIVAVGTALASEAFDEILYISDTDGKIDDGDGSPTADYAIGRVVPGFGNTTTDKLLHVDVSLI